ncbi:hypothetical protein ANO14919_099640 [Xylariales sp. No.14919]|nr:hypothetical protein F5X98DRAFT_380460 [Xylaria grammica]GAW20458.1 hypothetical protein ANO14919_099640 [Xylariales sp. No.14919]
MPIPRRSQERPATPRRRVSVSELPRLSRASTLDIELHYLKLHAKHRARCVKKTLCALCARVPRWFRLAIGMPFSLLLTLFTICTDVVCEKIRGVFDLGGSKRRDTRDEIWLPVGDGVVKDQDVDEDEDDGLLR